MSGPSTAAAASASSAAESGCVTNTLMSPWLMARARRSCCSAKGPRMRPMIAGATGKPKRLELKAKLASELAPYRDLQFKDVA